jgi:hypothetical protein
MKTKKPKPDRTDGMYVPPTPPASVPVHQLGQWFAEEYTKSRPRWAKIQKAVKPDAVTDRTLGMGVTWSKPKPPYKQPEAGPDPDYLSPSGYQKQEHQRAGRIVAKDLKPTNRDVE